MAWKVRESRLNAKRRSNSQPQSTADISPVALSANAKCVKRIIVGGCLETTCGTSRIHAAHKVAVDSIRATTFSN